MIPAVYGSEVHDVLLGVFATMEDVAGNLLLLQPANSPFYAFAVAREARRAANAYGSYSLNKSLQATGASKQAAGVCRLLM